MTTDTRTGKARLVVASNRGPISVRAVEGGEDQIDRGGGGLVSGMLGALQGRDDVVWVCAALNDVERALARESERGHVSGADASVDLLDGLSVRMLPIDSTTFRQAYNGIANSSLWYISHLLYDTARTPVFDANWRRQWAAYRRYNHAFAEALDAESAPEASVMVQDYHLNLVPSYLRSLRHDVRIAHFTHTPWAPPEYFQLFPDDIAGELLNGLLGADVLGFHTHRWAKAFLDCCGEILRATVEYTEAGGIVTAQDGRQVSIQVFPLGVDVEAMQDRSRQRDAEARMRTLQKIVGDRKVITRVDRTELSKNILRGLMAYREFLRANPAWHNRVIHLAFAYPSRHDLADYRAYTAEVKRLADEIDDEFGTDEWTPLKLEVQEDYPGSLAAMRMADVLLVNPIRDGMNLVVKEGCVLSERNGIAVLSRQAGAVDELGDDAVLINPFDVTGTAAALRIALEMPEVEKELRSARLRQSSAGVSPPEWFRAQIRAVSLD
ncbi:alpha,alpha-trehalose-phosphate synthase (UDP-forming) [Jatrophihabitans sp. DSM 45814]